MKYSDYIKQTKINRKELLNNIKANFDEANIVLPEFKYKDGKIQNAKQIKKRFSTWKLIILALWVKNYETMIKSNRKQIQLDLDYGNDLRKEVKAPVKKSQAVIDDIVDERMQKVKIKNVTNGNAKVFNKRIQNMVKEAYKTGKSKEQTMTLLQKEFEYNEKKAKSIAITERNYYISEAQLRAIEGIEKLVTKKWIHNDIGIPRPTHLEADGQIADEDGYFHVGEYYVKAPQHFGLPEQDINCHCGMRIDVKKVDKKSNKR